MTTRIITEANPQVQQNDEFIVLDTAINSVTAELPDARTCQGKAYSILALNITNTPTIQGGQDIGRQGSSFEFQVAGETLTIVSNGASWEILSHYTP